MATHPGMLIAYDAAGDVVATLDYVVQYADDADRTPIGIVAFAELEEAGREMTDVWVVEGAKGSKVWPEYLGSRAHDYRVELAGPDGAKQLRALVHKRSGLRRERAPLEAEIARRIEAAGDEPADIRDLVGGPDRPIHIDDHGRPVKRPAPPTLPLTRAR